MTGMPQSQSYESGSSQDLERRLAVVGPRDTTKGFLFGTALEVVKNQGTAAALRRCAAAAGSAHFMPFFSYPIATLLKLTYAVARELRSPYLKDFDGAVTSSWASAPRRASSSPRRARC